MSRFSRMTSAWWAVLGLGLLLVGCGNGTEPDVAAGRYRAHLEGSLTDTLTGPAVYRLQDDELVGIELGPRDGPGLSIQLRPRPLRPRTYEVTAAPLLEASSADSLTGVIAFLSVKKARLRAARGSLSVTHADDETMRGRFDFGMEGTMDSHPGKLSVRVWGELRATAK